MTEDKPTDADIASHVAALKRLVEQKITDKEAVAAGLRMLKDRAQREYQERIAPIIQVCDACVTAFPRHLKISKRPLFPEPAIHIDVREYEVTGILRDQIQIVETRHHDNAGVKCGYRIYLKERGQNGISTHIKTSHTPQQLIPSLLELFADVIAANPDLDIPKPE